MAVINFDFKDFEFWFNAALHYASNPKNPEDIRKEVYAGLSNVVDNCLVICNQSEVMSKFDLITNPELADEIKDMVTDKCPFVVQTLTEQGVFSESLASTVPYLDFWYDEYSGMYKYSTEIPESKTSVFG